MPKNTSVSLGDYFDKMITDMMKEGRYKNASEIIRAGLRLLEEEEHRIKAFQNAINEGMESGIAKGYNPKEHLEQLKDLHKHNAG